VIIRKNDIYIGEVDSEFALLVDSKRDFFKQSLFFDLEHYVYKKPICVGVFGCCYYDDVDKTLRVTQYMIENKNDALDILVMAKNYFEEMLKKDKKYIVTFSGNNDYTMINYLFNKYKMDFKAEERFIGVDLQKEYERVMKTSIGLKALEKKFGILRDTELISGANLAKTIHKIMKDDDYMNRMPEEKKEKILLYNDQDVVSLFHMCVNWDNFIKIEDVEEEPKPEPEIEIDKTVE
jgi:uncharacterized protein YprB with RNaseH-like and TPR domain